MFVVSQLSHEKKMSLSPHKGEADLAIDLDLSD